MDSAHPSLDSGLAAGIPPNPRPWRLWLTIIGFVLGVVPAVASWSYLLYLFHISNGARGIPPVPTNVDPQTQNSYLVTFGYLALLLTFAASPIGFLISLRVNILDAMARLFYPWRVGLALLSLIVSAGPTALLILSIIAMSMGRGEGSEVALAMMATPTPSENSAAPQRAPARGVALALVSVLLVVIALALDATVYLATFNHPYASVYWRSPLIIAATVGALILISWYVAHAVRRRHSSMSGSEHG